MPEIILSNVSVQFRVPGLVDLGQENMEGSKKIGVSLSNDWRNRPVLGALQKVNLSVEGGERLAIVGANGSGKTTLLRVISGILEPAEGFVQVKGRIASLISVTFGFDQNTSGRSNIIRRGLIMGMGRREIQSKIKDIIEFAELERYIDMPLYAYSAGMRLRLGFAITTALNADVILMDEWIGAGDRRFVERGRDRLLKLIDRSHVLVLTSHNYSLLRSLCTSVAVMWRGHLIARGSMEILDRIEAADGEIDVAYAGVIQSLEKNNEG